MSKTKIKIDELHEKVEFFNYPFSQDIFNKKYAISEEEREDINVALKRVAEAIMPGNKDLLKAMKLGLFIPAGRILAGAGTSKRVTLMNCYTNSVIEDSMRGIVREGNGNVADTLQQGGGIGTDFSTIRPRGASIITTGKGAKASGPVSFMRIYNETSQAVESAGARRGAMMATIRDTHPDLVEFITAKRESGALTHFNVSVLVSDAFIKAVEKDEDWTLHFPIEPADGVTKDYTKDINNPTCVDLCTHVEVLKVLDKSEPSYIYAIYKARDLWNMIMEYAYEYSEPGVIFIDNVNNYNNLYYCEDISCTNPCGEIPLPPNGACNLSHINVGRLVEKPFTKAARFDWITLSNVVALAIEFLDNVIDITGYPLEAQRNEQMDKRRTGLGISGLADAMAQLSMTYGSEESVKFAEQLIEAIAVKAYNTSIALGEERGAFGKYDASKFWHHPNESSVASKLYSLCHVLEDDVKIRNGVLLAIAPTGTTACAYGNISAGIEPVFAYRMGRKVDGEIVYNEAYLLRLYEAFLEEKVELEDLPSHFVASKDVSGKEHVDIQAACQKWIDSSISKTINLPKTATLEQVKDLYMYAYKSGCKGCTIYRESEVRGSILTDVAESESNHEIEIKITDSEFGCESNVVESNVVESAELELNRAVEKKRGEMLIGGTYKVGWKALHSGVYVTLNFSDTNGELIEILFNCKDHTVDEWLKAIGIILSIALQEGIPIKRFIDQMKTVHGKGEWVPGAGYSPSLIHELARSIEKGIEKFNYCIEGFSGGSTQELAEEEEKSMITEVTFETPSNGWCGKCMSYSIANIEGCSTCLICGDSKCG